MTLRRRIGVGTTALVALAALLVTGCGSSTPAASDSVEVSGAWARPTLPSATEAVVYLSVTSPEDDTVVSATVPASVARAATLHESMLLDGSDGMAPMPNMDMGDDDAGATTESMPPATVPLPAGEVTVFEPGGLHVMLLGLVQPLVADTTFPLTLRLERGGDVVVEVEVRTNAP